MRMLGSVASLKSVYCWRLRLTQKLEKFRRLVASSSSKTQMSWDPIQFCFGIAFTINCYMCECVTEYNSEESRRCYSNSGDSHASPVIFSFSDLHKLLIVSIKRKPTHLPKADTICQFVVVLIPATLENMILVLVLLSSLIYNWWFVLKQTRP